MQMHSDFGNPIVVLLAQLQDRVERLENQVAALRAEFAVLAMPCPRAPKGRRCAPPPPSPPGSLRARLREAFGGGPARAA